MKQLIFLIILTLLGIAGSAQTQPVRDAMYDKYGKDNAAKGEAWMKSMMSAKVEPEYRFPVMMKMRMTSYQKSGKKDENDITYYINTSTNRFAMRAQEQRRKKAADEMLMIYDNNANAMIMLNEADKTGMAMNMNALMGGAALAAKNQNKAGEQDEAKCKKTGKTKVVQGYSCEEYVCVNEAEGKRNEIWISTKVPFDLSQSAGKGALASYFNTTKGLGGMMMEGSFFKHDELEMKMEITEVNANENLVVKTSDYNFPMR